MYSPQEEPKYEKPKVEESKPALDYNAASLQYLQVIAKNTGATKGWITFIGILIIIWLAVELISSCSAAMF